MNRYEHDGFSIILILLSIGIMYLIKVPFEYMIWPSFAIYIGGRLPDILEPAYDYTHRDVFHSRKFLILLYYSLPITLFIGVIVNWVFFLSFLAIGYIGHLWLDSTTPMGLPY